MLPIRHTRTEKQGRTVHKRLSDSVDLMSFYGAGVLAGTVERYWHERGHANVIVERVEIFEGTWGVRSNLVAGLPPPLAADHD